MTTIETCLTSCSSQALFNSAGQWLWNQRHNIKISDISGWMTDSLDELCYARPGGNLATSIVWQGGCFLISFPLFNRDVHLIKRFESKTGSLTIQSLLYIIRDFYDTPFTNDDLAIVEPLLWADTPVESRSNLDLVNGKITQSWISFFNSRWGKNDSNYYARFISSRLLKKETMVGQSIIRILPVPNPSKKGAVIDILSN